MENGSCSSNPEVNPMENGLCSSNPGLLTLTARVHQMVITNHVS